jgi:hypothetical protein
MFLGLPSWILSILSLLLLGLGMTILVIANDSCGYTIGSLSVVISITYLIDTFFFKVFRRK